MADEIREDELLGAIDADATFADDSVSVHPIVEQDFEFAEETHRGLLASALEKIVEQVGKFEQIVVDACYVSHDENELANEGYCCGNCKFFQSTGQRRGYCKIVAGPIHAKGVCNFAIVEPDALSDELKLHDGPRQFFEFTSAPVEGIFDFIYTCKVFEFGDKITETQKFAFTGTYAELVAHVKKNIALMTEQFYGVEITIDKSELASGSKAIHPLDEETINRVLKSSRRLLNSEDESSKLRVRKQLEDLKSVLIKTRNPQLTRRLREVEALLIDFQ